MKEARLNKLFFHYVVVDKCRPCINIQSIYGRN